MLIFQLMMLTYDQSAPLFICKMILYCIISSLGLDLSQFFIFSLQVNENVIAGKGGKGGGMAH
jgi:hypothetical protein